MSSQIRLDDKVVLVTGASRGIGRATALLLGELGATVVVNYHKNADAAAEVVSAIMASGGKATPVQADVSDLEAVLDLVKATMDTWGRIDGLVNNAGIIRDAFLWRLSDDDWDSVLNTNLRGPFMVMREVLPIMMKQRSGSIVNLVSVSGQIGNYNQANYSAAKAGLAAITKSAAREVAPRGVRLNSVAPGYIETDMTSSLSDKVKQLILANIALKRYGKPEEVARAVAFLLSDWASYITGATLSVNGGMVMD